MNLERLMQSGFAAIADRGAQEAWKLLERTHLAPWQPGSASRRMPSEIVRAAVDIRRGDVSLMQKRFFAGAISPEHTKALLEQHCPESLRDTLAAAEKLRAESFDLLGYQGLQFGSPIDWHLDPVNGVRAPRVHWSRINGLDTAQVGDSKVTWELSRFQWWVTLARAFLISGDREIPKLIAAHAKAWRQENPVGIGINWASSLECALRLISWCWTAILLRGEGGLSQRDLEPLLLGIRDHAGHVSRYLSHHYSPNTHLTGEALGLFYAGCALPELGDAASFRNQGARILIEQLRTQVLPDGVYFEQAACYQRYTIEIYLHFLILASASGHSVPEECSATVTRLLDFLLAVRRPDGTMAPFGDADGGWIMPLAQREPLDVRGIFSTAAAWFARPDYAWAAQGIQPETLWLLGQQGLDAFRGLEPTAPAQEPTRIFPQGGYAVLASGHGPDAHQLIFDVGPLGCPVSGGHGHADLLSIQASVFGEPVIVDPGTGVYTGEWRAHFRSSAAHSTVLVDGSDQALQTGPFGWKQRPRATLAEWKVGDALELADASHEAYQRLAAPVRHRRRVFFVDRKFWIVVDDLHGAADATGEHQLDLQFQLAPLDVRRGGEPGSEWLRVLTPGGHALHLQSFSPAPLKLSLHEGESSPKRGWVAPHYGQRIPAPLAVFRARARLPLRLATVLVPLDRADDPVPALAVQESPAGPLGLQFPDGRVVHFGEAAAELLNE